MTYIYLSGAGTSENGKQFWQQVKSETEQEIQTKGFRRTFGFRPAIMKWAKGQKHIQTMQYFFLPLYPLMRLLRAHFTTGFFSSIQAMMPPLRLTVL